MWSCLLNVVSANAISDYETCNETLVSKNIHRNIHILFSCSDVVSGKKCHWLIDIIYVVIINLVSLGQWYYIAIFYSDNHQLCSQIAQTQNTQHKSASGCSFFFFFFLLLIIFHTDYGPYHSSLSLLVRYSH